MTSLSQTQDWIGWCYYILQCPLMTTKNMMTHCHSVTPPLDGAKKWCPNRQLLMAQLCLRQKIPECTEKLQIWSPLNYFFFLHVNSSASLWINWALFRDKVWAGTWSRSFGGYWAPVLQGCRLDLRPDLAQEDGDPVGKDCILPPCPGATLVPELAVDSYHLSLFPHFKLPFSLFYLIDLSQDKFLTRTFLLLMQVQLLTIMGKHRSFTWDGGSLAIKTIVAL